MGLQIGNIVFTGTIDKLCFYKSCGQYCVRKSSSLTGKRVKKDPAFARTMENAGILARASRIGSSVYRSLPKAFRQFWMYKAFTGEAIQLLRQGKTDEEARITLWKTYAEIWVNKDMDSLSAMTTMIEDVSDKNKNIRTVVRTSEQWSNETIPTLHKNEKTISPVLSLHPIHQLIRRRRRKRA